MEYCFKIAEQGSGFVSPNPLVGSILVKDHQIIAQGYHQRYGQNHAEKNCLEDLSLEQTSNSILFCNLEPCSHTNKQTPPCTDLIIKKKISHVIIANIDPNPNVSGAGIKKLQDNGIKVETGIAETFGKKFNEFFFYHIKNQLPFVTLKWGQSLDGKLALINGDSKWITNEKARQKVAKLRLEHDGILVGPGTLIHDNPNLLPRDINNQILMKKKRFIFWSPKLNLSDYQVFNDQFASDTYLIASTQETSTINYPIQKIITFDEQAPREEQMKIILKKIYQLGCYSLLIEGGPKILSTFFQLNLFQKICVFISPVILGQGLSINQNINLEKLPPLNLHFNLDSEILDDNVLLTYRWISN
jgi:diaminohydroxyphosphoribosylaminopyrimidine deaminase/5-amino-6-(5-phosphoribosylamino)uracil reductase